jgi:hypothetical protein
MAIDRGPWNALVDDDGSNLVGSVWNKAAIKTVLLDPMDGALTPFVFGTPHGVAPFSAGQVDNLAGNATSTVWLLSSTLAMYLTGIVSPIADGTLHILINNGSNLITLAHMFGSLAPNQFIGSGYANTDLPPWKSLSVIYIAGYQKWVVLKP